MPKSNNTIKKVPIIRGGNDLDSLAGVVARLLVEWPESSFLGDPSFTSKEPPLSTIQAQVSQPLRIKDLRKNSIIENLEALGYQKQTDLLKGCGNAFVHLECPNGHEKYTRIHCHREYCPACGKAWSLEHKKRAMRAAGRLLWAPVLGYLVFTLPGEVSSRRPDQDRLNELCQAVRPLIKKYFDTPGGVSRYHLFGNRLGTFHTHLNVLFPITNPSHKGKIEKENLERLKIDYTRIVNDIFGLKISSCVVFYNFAYKKAKMFHKIKYVMRPIVTTDHFEVLDSESIHHVMSLERWHNTRWFGELANNKHNEYLLQAQDERDIEEPIEQQDHGSCPVCNKKYRYIEVVSWKDLPHEKLRYTDENTFYDLATFDYLKDNSPP